MANYDPSKKYSWKNDEQFVISGAEFGLMLNAFRAALNTDQAAQILLIERANSVVEKLMADYVEKGVIKESEDNNVKKMEVIK